MGGKQIRAAIAEFVDIDGILAAQDEAGVDRVLLCPWVPLLYYDAEPDEGLARARIQNDALAGLARDHPDRVTALGALPLQDPELAARELQDVMARGELKGVEVAASVRGVFLGDDRFEPFWEAAESTGAVVFIHPTTRGFDSPAFQDYYLWNTVANPLETATAAAHMVVAGVMERHPELRVLLAHGGRRAARGARAYAPRSRIPAAGEVTTARVARGLDPALLLRHADARRRAAARADRLRRPRPRAARLGLSVRHGRRRGTWTRCERSAWPPTWRRRSSPATRSGLLDDMTHTADIVVAGAGHNSLITAAYLAKAGHECLVLDARPIPGGGAATEELLGPGYRIDSCSTGHTIIRVNPAADERRARAPRRLRARVPRARPGRPRGVPRRGAADDVARP